MITIPVTGFNPQENEELNTICKALFIEVNDKRLMSIMSKEEVDSYVNILMDGGVCESLYEMVSLFGEDDFIKFIKPLVSDLASFDYDAASYLTTFKKSLEELT